MKVTKTVPLGYYWKCLKLNLKMIQAYIPIEKIIRISKQSHYGHGFILEILNPDEPSGQIELS